MAGVPGFEPRDGGVRVRCLTVWLYPKRSRFIAEYYCLFKHKHEISMHIGGLAIAPIYLNCRVGLVNFVWVEVQCTILTGVPDLIFQTGYCFNRFQDQSPGVGTLALFVSLFKNIYCCIGER